MEFELEGFNELEIGADIVPASPRVIQALKPHGNAIDPALVSKARAMYISGNMSLAKVSSALGVSENTLKDYCKREKWTLYRTSPDLMEWSEEMFDDIYGNVNFYDRAKEVLAGMIEVDAFQSPKDVKAIIESYKIAEERTTSLRLIRENASTLDGDL